MKFWQNISWIELDQMIEMAKFAEELGFEGVMDGDHVFFPDPLTSGYPYTPDGTPPMGPADAYPDNFACAGAIAAVTTRLRYATQVFILPPRNPLMVAKAAATVAILSNHRFILGVGVGWMKEECEQAGVDFHSRGRRTDEMIEVMRKLWPGDTVEHHGEFFDFAPLRMPPAPGRQVPIYAGGYSQAAMRRSARLDGFLSAGNKPEEVPGVIAELNEMRRELGRDHLPFETIFPLTTPYSLDDFKRVEDAGADGIMAHPPKFTIGTHSTIDQKKAEMERFAENFIRHMT